MNPVRDLGRNALFDVLFVYENADDRVLRFDGLSVSPQPVPRQTSAFDLTFEIAAREGVLDIVLEYSADLFKPETMTRWLGYYAALIREIVREPEKRLGELELASADEKNQLLTLFNQTGLAAPKDRSLTDLFEERARAVPDRQALVDGEHCRTYQSLDRAANQLARALTDKGVGLGDAVVLCLPRSAEYVIAILAVLKAGGVYIPSDPSYPAARIEETVRDSGAVLIASRRTPTLQLPRQTQRLSLPLPEDAPSRRPLPRVRPESHAYIIYTSGSTGKPKGVVAAHQSVVNFIFAMNDRVYPERSGPLNIGLAAPFVFDASVQQIFGALLFGHCLHVLDEETIREPVLLTGYIRDREIRVFGGTPTLFAMIAAHGWRTADRLPPTRWIIGGEPLSRETVALFYAKPATADAVVVNVYGPTECTVNVTTVAMTRANYRELAAMNGVFTIGRPLGNSRIYILDADDRPAPIGVSGEIRAGGANLCEGYHQKPALTAERFVPDPFGVGTRLYRTGDLGRWLADGNITFCGRIDQQLKIRGHRIEPAEIEAALRQHPAVQETVVVARPDLSGATRLIAYWTPRPDAERPESAAPRAFCERMLPEYMIPSLFVKIEALPLNANGKIDVKALPDPEPRRSDDHFRAPHGFEQETLARIWSEVLHLDRVGVDDNYFVVGGDSIKAILVTNRMREAGWPCSVRELFRNPTIAGLTSNLAPRTETKTETGVEGIPFDVLEKWFFPENPPENARLQTVSAILESVEAHGLRRSARPGASNAIDQDDPQQCFESLRQNICEDILPLTPMQEGLLFHALFDEGGTYVEQDSLTFEGRLDLHHFQRCCRSLIQRHAVLRTSFPHKSLPRPVQFVARDIPPDLTVFDLRELDEASRTERVAEITRSERETRFDLASQTAIRFRLMLLSDTRARLLATHHHILLDGWSGAILFSELLAMLRSGSVECDLPPVRPYRDFVLWLANRNAEQGKRYWNRYLEGYSGTASLPKLRGNHETGQPEPRQKSFSLDESLTASIQDFAARQRVTPNTVIQCLWALILCRYNNAAEVVFGITVSGRPEALSGVERMVGLFINTVPLRIKPDRTLSFGDLVRRVQQDELESKDHQYGSLSELRREGRSGHDAIDHLLAFENYPLEQSLQTESDAEIAVTDASVWGRTHFDLELVVFPDRRLRFELKYNAAVYDASSLDRVASAFTDLALRLTTETAPIQDLDRNSRAESALLDAFHRLEKPTFPARSPVALFEEASASGPDAAALVHGETRLTYQVLNARVNRLAHRLTRLGMGPGRIVALLLKRSPDLVTALWAVHKTGSAYLPLAPDYPESRIREILADSRADLLLVDEPEANDSRSWAASVLSIGQLDAADLPPHNPEPITEPGNAAYLINTSGSTGRPKGCVVSFSNLAHYLAQARAAYFADPEAGHFPLFTAPTFDLTVTSLFCSLTRAKTLHIFDEDRDIGEILRACFGPGSPVDTVKMTPAHTAILRELALTRTSVQTVILGGERVDETHAQTLRALNPDISVYNEYGPTETTVGCIVRPMRTPSPHDAIGKPLPGVGTRILDRWGGFAPVGVCGEICIEGPGLARGYHDRPELTAERFIPAPNGRRRYRTGDAGRWLPDGQIEFLGRLDDQVKLHGYRIEPGEIESALRELDGVRQTAVLVREDRPGERRLVALIVADDDRNLSHDAFYDQLKRRLPAYMIPSDFVMLERLPLTRHGKIDRSALAQIDLPGETAGLGNAYLAPADPIQATLVKVWQQVLNHRPIGVRDNFFALGGDSIKAIQIVSRLHREKIKLTVRSLFAQPSIEKLAGLVTHEFRSIPRGPVTGPLPLTPIQSWFFQEQTEARDHYNQSLLLTARERLRPASIRAALTAILTHHDALRCRFREEQGGILVEQTAPTLDLKFEVVDLRGLADTESEQKRLTAAVQRGLNLERGPLMRAVLFRLDSGDQLLWVIHHLVVDGVSWRILVEDLESGYTARQRGEPIQLPAKTDAFKTWSERIAAHAANGLSESERAYWQTAAATYAEPLTRDMGAQDEPPGPIADADQSSITLAATETRSLLTEAHQTYRTEINELLLTGLAKALKTWRGADRTLIAMEGHGREELFDDCDISRTVGWFTSIFPFALAAPEKDDLGYQIKHIKEQIRAIPARGVGYGVLRYGSAHEKANGFLSCRPPVAFNYLGRFDTGGGSLFSEIAEGGDEMSPLIQRQYELEITALVLDEQMTFYCRYNRRHYRSAAIEHFLAAYKDALLEIIDYCKDRPEELTPSDLTIGDMSLDEFEELFEDA